MALFRCSILVARLLFSSPPPPLLTLHSLCECCGWGKKKKKTLQIFPPEQPHLIRFLSVSTPPPRPQHHPPCAEPRESAASSACSIFKFHLCSLTEGERPTASTVGDCYTFRRAATLGRHLAEAAAAEQILHLADTPKWRSDKEVGNEEKRENLENMMRENLAFKLE